MMMTLQTVSYVSDMFVLSGNKYFLLKLQVTVGKRFDGLLNKKTIISNDID